MEQTFIKRIQGHELQFNRKMFPLSYAVSLNDLKQSGVVLSLNKDEKGMWYVTQSEGMPVWFNEISLDIHYVIEENEVKINNTLSAASAIENKQNSFEKSLRLSCLY
ncbi:MAG: hypothetical protein JWQ40_1176 [Segetibacter sp.]|jgi:hypothetical protein|nr:hypothetical protein [Segetibacter sp.]